MKRAALAALALPLILALGSVAMADDRHDGRRDHGSHDRRHDNDRWRDHDRRDHRYDGRRDDRRWDNQRWNGHRYHAPRYRAPPGYRNHHWRRGDRLPRAYYGRPYIVSDYHVYRLHRPPHGHHWVRVNQDVVLTAIATGVVLDVIYNHFY